MSSWNLSSGSTTFPLWQHELNALDASCVSFSKWNAPHLEHLKSSCPHVYNKSAELGWLEYDCKAAGSWAALIICRVRYLRRSFSLLWEICCGVKLLRLVRCNSELRSRIWDRLSADKLLSQFCFRCLSSWRSVESSLWVRFSPRLVLSVASKLIWKTFSLVWIGLASKSQDILVQLKNTAIQFTDLKKEMNFQRLK